MSQDIGQDHQVLCLPVECSREEMAQTVEDVLARRVRALFMDARAAIDMAPRVASIMAREMGKDKKWENEQVEEFTRLAKNYILA